MKGYFAIGAEGISKPMNLGALMRTANAFGAAFVFSVKAEDRTKIAYKSDTSRTFKNLPYYSPPAHGRLCAGARAGESVSRDGVAL